MHTENLTVDDLETACKLNRSGSLPMCTNAYSSEIQMIEDLAACFPDRSIAVFCLAFVWKYKTLLDQSTKSTHSGITEGLAIEPINLSNLSTLVVPSE
jgi:hypothetical protein